MSDPAAHDPGPPLGTALDDVLAGVARAHEGDADAIAEVVVDDVVWVDEDDRCEGVDEVVEHFLAHGGWREVFEVREVRPLDGGRWAVDWTLWLRADATSYRREGRAEVVVVTGEDGPRIASWTTSATEHEDGSLAPWSGD